MKTTFRNRAADLFSRNRIAVSCRRSPRPFFAVQLIQQFYTLSSVEYKLSPLLNPLEVVPQICPALPSHRAFFASGAPAAFYLSGLP